MQQLRLNQNICNQHLSQQPAGTNPHFGFGAPWYLDTTNKGKWKLLFDMELKNYGCENLFRCNLNVNDTKKMIKVKDPFLKEISEYWAETNFERQVTSEINFREQSLWFNSLIRIDNKPIFFKDWLEKGITKVKHLQRTENNGFLSLNDLASKYDIKLRPLSFYGLLSAENRFEKPLPELLRLEKATPV